MDPCQSRIGLSFAASYQQQPGELFFTRLLRFIEITQSCSFSAFLPLTSDYRALGLSLHTECPLLAIGELILPQMSHTITFIGSQRPNCFTSNFLGLSDPALVIESEMVNHRLPLGNIFELQANSGGPDVVTVFERGEGSGPVSLFHSVQVTLFGGVFQSEATVRNHQLTISTSSSGGASVFGYPAQMTITAPSNNTNWQDLELTVDGSLLPGNGSFIENLSRIVIRKLIDLAQVGHTYHVIAQSALDRSMEMVTATESEFDDVVKQLTRAEEHRATAYIAIRTVQVELDCLQQEIARSGDELGAVVDILDGLCIQNPCECSCVHGEVCRSFTSPLHSSQCPTGAKEQSQAPSFSVTRTTCRFEVEYILEVNQTYRDSDCSAAGDGDSYNVSTTQQPLIPVQDWRNAGVDMQLSENCTIDHKVIKNTLSGPEMCCENVSCAVFAPNSSCLAKNRICRSVRQRTLNSLEGITNEERKLLQRFLDTQSALVSAQIDSRKAELENVMYLQKRERLNMSLIRFRDEHNRSMAAYGGALEEVETFLKLYESGKRNGFQNIFTVSSVTFSTALINNPTSLAFNVEFQKQMGEIFEDYQESYLYISSQSEEINLERIANEIVDAAFIGQSTENISRSKRQSMTRDDLQTPNQGLLIAIARRKDLVVSPVQTFVFLLTGIVAGTKNG